jgi:hypothetical protein
MRRWIVILLALQLVLCATSLVRADGIFQRTPKVGEWTRFFYEMQADDEDEARTGTMTIRCLSFEKVEEVELATRLTDDDESVDLAFRMLIPANRFENRTTRSPTSCAPLCESEKRPKTFP